MVSLLLRLFVPKCSCGEKARNAYGYVCGGVGIFLNLLLFGLKLFIGIISMSVAITADAFNNLSDAFSSAASLLGFLFSSRKADSDHPFGHGRVEYIAGTFISAAVILVGVELIQTSVDKIRNGGEIIFNRYVLIILIFSILVKLYMAYYNSVCGKKIGSASLKAVAADSLSDSISTGAILLSSVFTHYTGINIDGWAGLVVSALIIRTGVLAVIDTASPLLGNAPDKELVEKIEKIVRSCPETAGIHDLVVHDYGPNKVFVSLHMEVDGSKEIFMLHDAVDGVEKEISEKLGCEAVIHMDPIDLGNPLLKEVYEALNCVCRQYSDGVNVHDLRVVPGPTHTNIIFDVVIPPDLFPKKDEICSDLENCITSYGENYFAVITAEASYCG